MARYGFPSVNSVAAKLALGVVAGSVLFALGKASFGSYFLLSPSAVWAGEVWRLFSYSWVAASPGSVIFGALILWWTGGSLEQAWRSRRLLFFCFFVPLVAAGLTVLVSLLWTRLLGAFFPGAQVMVTAVWVAYGLSLGRGQTLLWGVLPLSGNALAWGALGFIFLEGVFNEWAIVVPEAFGAVLAFGYMKAGSPYGLWLRFTSWRLRRKLLRPGKHLRVVEKPRDTSSRGPRKYLN